jgi:pyruvate kinase
MRKQKGNKTKIIATLGPASAHAEMIDKLMHAGVDVFRLNFSHGTHEQHAQTFQLIKDANKKNKKHVSILADLQGPKIRLGEIIPLTVLKEGDELEITTLPCMGNNKKIFITYTEFPKDVQEGETVLIDDGKIELKVLETNGKDTVKTKIIFGGPVSSKKGVNLPDTKVSIPSLTEKDHEDLLFALQQGANWIALSFVRNADDINHLKNSIKHHGHHTKVIAKIEKPEALKNIDAIIDATDAIMVARGDLGVEMPVEIVPFTQKDLCRKCIEKTTPVIIATQMMESMIENPHPTRAEVTDVANAVLDGADAVMLSAETATGRYPEMVIKTMVRIIEQAEKEDIVFHRRHEPDKNSNTYLSDAICFNACNIAEEVNAAAVMGMTKTGYTAFMVSSCRPRANIYIFTNNEEVVNILNLLWGVEAFYYGGMKGTNNTFKEVQEFLKKRGNLNEGDVVVNLGTMPVKEMARTNTLKISVVQ